MIIINTTFHVAKPLTEEFVKWIREEYAPAAAKADMVAPRLTEIFDGADPSAVSYAFSVTTRNMEEAKKWHEGETASKLRECLTNKHGENILFFTTFMQSISLFS